MGEWTIQFYSVWIDMVNSYQLQIHCDYKRSEAANTAQRGQSQTAYQSEGSRRSQWEKPNYKHAPGACPGQLWPLKHNSKQFILPTRPEISVRHLTTRRRMKRTYFREGSLVVAQDFSKKVTRGSKKVTRGPRYMSMNPV